VTGGQARAAAVVLADGTCSAMQYLSSAADQATTAGAQAHTAIGRESGTSTGPHSDEVWELFYKLFETIPGST
jgi:hypothetical protein